MQRLFKTYSSSLLNLIKILIQIKLLMRSSRLLVLKRCIRISIIILEFLTPTNFKTTCKECWDWIKKATLVDVTRLSMNLSTEEWIFNTSTKINTNLTQSANGTCSKVLPRMFKLLMDLHIMVKQIGVKNQKNSTNGYLFLRFSSTETTVVLQM